MKWDFDEKKGRLQSDDRKVFIRRFGFMLGRAKEYILHTPDRCVGFSTGQSEGEDLTFVDENGVLVWQVADIFFETTRHPQADDDGGYYAPSVRFKTAEEQEYYLGLVLGALSQVNQMLYAPRHASFKIRAQLTPELQARIDRGEFLL